MPRILWSESWQGWAKKTGSSEHRVHLELPRSLFRMHLKSNTDTILHSQYLMVPLGYLAVAIPFNLLVCGTPHHIGRPFSFARQ